MDEKIVLKLPITPYRSFQKSDIKGNNRVLIGIDNLMTDAASLSLMAETIGQGSESWKDATKRSRTISHKYYFNSIWIYVKYISALIIQI